MCIYISNLSDVHLLYLYQISIIKMFPPLDHRVSSTTHLLPVIDRSSLLVLGLDKTEPSAHISPLSAFPRHQTPRHPDTPDTTYPTNQPCPAAVHAIAVAVAMKGGVQQWSVVERSGARRWLGKGSNQSQPPWSRSFDLLPWPYSYLLYIPFFTFISLHLLVRK